ncbi:MAG: DUF4105 domain-containing protein [Victivallaceae bacterium]
MKKIMFKVWITILIIASLLAGLWCVLAIYYRSPFTPGLCAGLYAVIFLTAISLTFIRKFRIIATASTVFMLLAVLTWWLTISATNDQDWQLPWAKMPYAEINGQFLTIHNIRDFHYRSENDYEVRYCSEMYNLDKLNTVNLALSYWDGNKAVAHTMLDFGFSDGKWLVISSETRLKNGQTQGALAGLFKQYQALYVFGTERDLLMLRTNFRGEDVYVYPTITTPAEARILLLDLVKRANQLFAHPEFYNTISSNCSTSLVPSLRKIRPPRGWDIRILLNGLAGKMAFENGWLKHAPDISFEEYKAKYAVTEKMKKCTVPESYSQTLHAASEK